MLVKNIKYSNNKIEIILEDKSFFISKENYLDNPVAINSDLDEKKINFLLNNENVISAKNGLIKILKTRLYSEYKAREYLKNKELNYKEINKIIESLLRMGLLNDDYYASLKVNVLVGKRKGKLEIRKLMHEEKIKDEIIDKVLLEIDDEVYKNNFNKVYEKYLKIYEKSSGRVKEKMIKNKLREYGYESYLIDEVRIQTDNKKEIELARIQLNKILKSKNYDLSIYENINKIKAKLVNKGFSYDIINLVLEEVL